MSSWVHVCGVMRIDDLRLRDGNPDFDELIGKECLFNDNYEVWEDAESNPDKYLPMGSEGSLQKSVWINPDKNCIAAYTVTIFGDLRDCYEDDAKKIIQWFKEKAENLLVRNAVICVEYEYGNKIETWTYGEGKQILKISECNEEQE